MPTLRLRPSAFGRLLLASALAVGGAGGCTAPAKAPAAASATSAERPVLLQRVDDVAIAQLYADGFENLSLDDQRLCWHLTQAAIAGRDIYLQQRCAEGLAIRDL